jgi:hypothetical protein
MLICGVGGKWDGSAQVPQFPSFRWFLNLGNLRKPKKSISDGHIGTTAVLTNLNVEYDAVETGDTALNNCFFINTLMSLEDKLIFSEAEMLRILLMMDTYKDC